MKVLGNVTGYLTPVYGTYAYNKNSVSSCLGNSKQPLYLNFASEDRVIQDILKKYSVAGAEKKQELFAIYKNRVNELIANCSFALKDLGKQDRLPCLEVDEHQSSEFLVCISGGELFSSLGSDVLVDNKFYPYINVVRKVETGFGMKRRTDGFFSIPAMPGFCYYILSVNKASNDKYYLEEVTIDFDKETSKSSEKFLDSAEVRVFRKGKIQL